MKKYFPLFIIFIVPVFLFLFLSQKPKSVKEADSDLLFFYGITCPHCKTVEEHLDSDQLEQKLSLSRYEVYQNASNSNLFTGTVQAICPDEASGAGLPVPFLIDQQDKKCIIGDQPIIDYLDAKVANF